MRAHWLLLTFVLVSQAPLSGQVGYLVVSRDATIKREPDRDAEILLHVTRGLELLILEGEKTNGYYHVQVPDSNDDGWIYKTLARRYEGLAPSGSLSPPLPDSISACSFNIKWIGSYAEKQDTDLAELLRDYDIVIVQELVAPPVAGVYPDGAHYEADPEAASFLEAMTSLGFHYALSPEDTGPGVTIHNDSSGTEWFLTFYRDNLELAEDLPQGFLAEDRSAHSVYRRVPYATGLRTRGGDFDFVVINVHLWPDAGSRDERKAELQAIADWVAENDDEEKDFLIVGDMNIESRTELEEVVPAGFVSLNAEVKKTNTAATAKPYDHVLYRPAFSAEVDTEYGFQVVDLIQAMVDRWPGPGAYPGIPYDRYDFPKYYSDHHPVTFRLQVPAEDDD